MNELRESDEELNAADIEDDFFGGEDDDEEYDFGDDRSLIESDEERIILNMNKG